MKKLVLAILLGLPFLFLLLPADFFDQGESICPSKRFFDVECLGCGLTRAVMHFIHGDIETALRFNKLVIPVVIFAGLVWLYFFGKLINRKIVTFMAGFIEGKKKLK